MSSWNHRVVKRVYPGFDGNSDETVYGIHEVYYDSQGNPESCTENPVAPIGNTLDELAKEMRWFVSALNKPWLDFDQIKAREMETLLNDIAIEEDNATRMVVHDKPEEE